MTIEGVGKSYSAAIMKVYWLDGQMRAYTVTSGRPNIRLYGSADDQRGPGEIAWAYGVIGVEHIFAGVDHLLFVIGLLILVGFNRRLAATITAYTVAHSLTLGPSALGWLTLRSPQVEATIALSIMLVSVEALHTGATLSRQWPAAVALIFGLVHGLGSVPALNEIGLPRNNSLVALLTFNVGVDLGQLAVVAIAYLVCWSLTRWPTFPRARVPAIYLISSIATY